MLELSRSSCVKVAALVITMMSLIAGIAALLTPKVWVDCGKLMVQGYNSCQINHNDEEIPYAGPEKTTIPDLRFGLVTYVCDHELGYFMSEVDCEKCGLNCTEEASVDPSPCPADPTQFWAGLVLGVGVYVLIGALTYKRLLRLLDNVPARSADDVATGTQAHDAAKSSKNDWP
nr:PREDICTED: uncharacterized protein LOC109043395 [Bemisia tabaci]XP_018916133.1 PREDICTED: uncharacterized protein LOC109043395 [Bemisia tabaci]